MTTNVEQSIVIFCSNVANHVLYSILLYTNPTLLKKDKEIGLPTETPSGLVKSTKGKAKAQMENQLNVLNIREQVKTRIPNTFLLNKTIRKKSIFAEIGHSFSK